MERRGLHITNTVFVGTTLFIFSLAFFGGFFFKFASDGNLSGFFNITLIPIVLGFVSSAVYFILLISSFKQCNLNNSPFKWADSLNLFGLVASILAVIVLFIFLSGAGFSAQGLSMLERSNYVLKIVTWIGAGIYSISFVVFLVGYFKFKKK